MVSHLGKCRYGNRHRKFPVITLFSMLGEIEALNFMMFRNTQTHDNIDDFQDRKRSRNRQRSRNANANGLVQKLMRVPFQSAGCEYASACIFEDGIHRAAGEDAGKQCAQSSACAVNAEGVERVVISEASFYMRDHQIA